MMQNLSRWVLGWFGPVERRPLWVVIGFGVVMLGLRLLLARPFWNSGQTRWVQFPTELSSSTTYLFENLFQLHFFWGTYPMPFPQFSAWVTGIAEIVLPVLLIVGLGTRLWALALLGMTVIIQLTFPDAFWNPSHFLDSHSAWFLFAILIVIGGGGCFSLDWVVRKLRGDR